MNLHEKIFNNVSAELGNLGAKVAITSINTLPEINEIYKNFTLSETFDKKLYDLYLTRYSEDYKSVMPNAESIIVVAYPQKITEIYFNYKDSKIRTIIPPTYIYRDEKIRVAKVFEKTFSKYGYIF
ncbi:MAG: hypothetical protein M1409_01420, partial [Actinobacteria bacterium]|nr:hypothetical protein [Actinomycetota bacterium]